MGPQIGSKSEIALPMLYLKVGLLVALLNAKNIWMSKIQRKGFLRAVENLAQGGRVRGMSSSSEHMDRLRFPREIR